MKHPNHKITNRQLRADKVYYGNGTASMIAPGICATAAHFLHVDADISKLIHQKFEIIRTADIETHMLWAKLIGEDITTKAL